MRSACVSETAQPPEQGFYGGNQRSISPPFPHCLRAISPRARARHVVRKGPVLSDVAFVPIALGSLRDLGAQPPCRAPGRAPGSPSALARAWCGTARLSSTSLPFAAAPGSALGALQTLLRARRFALLQHFKKSKRCP